MDEPVGRTNTAVSEEMSALRSDVDAIDEAIVRLLAARFTKTARIGEIKALIGEAAIHPARHAQRLLWLQELSGRYDVDAELVHAIFDAIRLRTVARHEQAKGLAIGQSRQAGIQAP